MSNISDIVSEYDKMLMKEYESHPTQEDLALKVKLLEDTHCEHATLMSASAYEATFELQDKRIIKVSANASSGEDKYSIDMAMFNAWIRDTRRTLLANGINPQKIRMPGSLSVSHAVRVVFGWQEDYSDDESKLLAMDEVIGS